MIPMIWIQIRNMSVRINARTQVATYQKEIEFLILLLQNLALTNIKIYQRY